MNNSSTSSSTSNPNNNNVSIEYSITCNDDKGQEAKFVFHEHTAPLSICRKFDLSSDNQAKAQTVALMAGLVKAHHNEVFQARSWSCVECNQPATVNIHNPMSYLHLPKPQIMDIAVPCCTSKLCEASIRAHFGSMMAVLGVPNGLL